ncbi:phosphonate C-P lyase system protein PhnG [Waterburya agarophytonicola K14]|uniref:Phosphonate C-P lyase system protein PhnG n=1 Tax=Waterburya agarophytonicola KI4 TaxID=2874699 RepID=A0A964BPB7_9CYAN|nr:phosphonate C-P lyase system protein PhnG [Waterburya agarophytonicola]MCC0177094.1 phosphonate C-P lyase system protein PhnG [Waterburya agarophytonicola KI4]
MSPSTARQTWMAILAKSSPVDLEQQVQTLGKLPKYTFLRQSEIGLAMVRGRAGGTGEAFNLGEMTVTRCVIKMEDIKGFGYVGGRSKRHAELAAVCDGLLQQKEWYKRVQELVIQPLQAKLSDRQQKQQRQTEATKVEFFTMLRGE